MQDKVIVGPDAIRISGPKSVLAHQLTADKPVPPSLVPSFVKEWWAGGDQSENWTLIVKRTLGPDIAGSSSRGIGQVKSLEKGYPSLGPICGNLYHRSVLFVASRAQRSAPAEPHRRADADYSGARPVCTFPDAQMLKAGGSNTTCRSAS